MFSPYYAWAGRGEPRNHVALNVALYGPRGRWAMTERGRAALGQSADTLSIGPSAMRWDGTGLTIDIEERAVPHLTRIAGRVRLMPSALTGHSERIDTMGRHVWRPFAPSARVEVALDRPALRWRGHGYFDANFGARPLEADFRFWTWARAALRGGAAVAYDTLRRDGRRGALSLRFRPDGRVEEVGQLAETPLARTLWRLPRSVRADPGSAPRIVRTLEDAPFYARSEIAGRMWGEAASGIHESLDLDRFATRWCKLMLPFRMPRRG